MPGRPPSARARPRAGPAPVPPTDHPPQGSDAHAGGNTGKSWTRHRVAHRPRAGQDRPPEPRIRVARGRRSAGSSSPRSPSPHSSRGTACRASRRCPTPACRRCCRDRTAAVKAELEADAPVRLGAAAADRRRPAQPRRPPARPSAAADRRTRDRGSTGAVCPASQRGSRALPYVNALGLVPGSRERGTTAITYLGFPSSVTPGEQDDARRPLRADVVSVPGAPAAATGFLPGSIAQSDAIDDGLVWVELASDPARRGRFSGSTSARRSRRSSRSVRPGSRTCSPIHVMS